MICYSLSQHDLLLLFRGTLGTQKCDPFADFIAKMTIFQYPSLHHIDRMSAAYLVIFDINN